MTPPSAPTTIRGLLERIRDDAYEAAPKFILDLLKAGTVLYCPDCDSHFRPGEGGHEDCPPDEIEAYYWLPIPVPSSLLGGVVPTNTKEEK